MKINPYTALKRKFEQFIFNMQNPQWKTMFFYSNEELYKGQWTLWDVNERVRAAYTLGYDVHLVSDDKGLTIRYVKRVEIPYL